MTDTTYTRYGVVDAGDPDEAALDYHPHDDIKDAHRMRRYLDKNFAGTGPHRVVTLRITIFTEEKP